MFPSQREHSGGCHLLPPRSQRPWGRRDHSPARSSTEKPSDDEPVRSSGLTGSTCRAHVGWKTPRTLWSCGVPLALRQTEAGLRGPHGHSQGDGGGGPLVGQGLSVLEDEQTSASSSSRKKQGGVGSHPQPVSAAGVFLLSFYSLHHFST